MKDEVGTYKGRHYTTYVGEVEQLKRDGQLDEARDLLTHLVEATEREARVTRQGVAPWYYEQLAIIARKQRDPEAERAILERFARQRHAPGVVPGRLTERLQKLHAGS